VIESSTSVFFHHGAECSLFSAFNDDEIFRRALDSDFFGRLRDVVPKKDDKGVNPLGTDQDKFAYVRLSL
jgi:hypothetical protein